MLAEATMVEVALSSTLTHALLLPLLRKVQTLNPLVTALSTMLVSMQFINKFNAALSELVATMHCKFTSYHPQSDDQTERMSRCWKTRCSITSTQDRTIGVK